MYVAKLYNTFMLWYNAELFHASEPTLIYLFIACD